MEAMLFVLPALGLVGYFVYQSFQSGVQPPPGVPTSQSNGTRYQSYISQIQNQMLTYQASSAFGATPAGMAMNTRLTIQTVQAMAQTDAMSGNITAQDLANINAYAANALKQVV